MSEPAEAAAEILVVDDDADVRMFVRTLLEGDHHKVIEAASGQEALERLRQHRPRLVLLDVIMPAMDGYAVVHAIRRGPGPFLPIIFLTGLDDPDTRARGIEAGADEVLVKPVHPFELKLRVRAMLRIQHLTEALHNANQRLRAVARTDELTGVYNRRGLRSALTREFRRAARYGGALSVMIFDVDRFKSVNDHFGHVVGDEALRRVAQALRGGVREVDFVGRVGGDEFVVLAPETAAKEALAVADRLRSAVAEQVLETRSGPLELTVSGGIATLSEVSARSPEELLAIADSGLYRAKALGRNRVAVAERASDAQRSTASPSRL